MEYKEKYDVIVVGLGTAGSIALIKAAQHGLRVLGIEKLSQMGGTGTAGGISHYYYGLDGGFYKQLDDEADRLRDSICNDCGAVRTDVLAYVLEKKAKEYGADILYNAVVTDVYRNEKKVYGLRCLKNGKSTDLSSKIVIDATGDADICRMAGCLMQGGRESDGQMQTYANVLMVLQDNNVYGINKDAGYINQNDNANFSEKIIESSAFLYNICNEYKDRLSFVSDAMLIGCREGMRIEGEENITFENCTECHENDKTVFYAFSNIDSHSKDIAFENRNTKDWYIAAGLWGVGIKCAVPMGALIPKDYDGILAAGRCIAAEHEMSGCIRMMRDMKKCGEAAAEMAYLAISDGVRPIDIDYQKLSCALCESGCLDREQKTGLANRAVNTQESTPFEWITDENEIISQLSGDKSGVAIWSAKRLGKTIQERLNDSLGDESKILRVNSAFALALLGDKSAIPILRDLVKERNITIPKSSVKFTYAWGVTAEYLLGRLQDEQSIELLLEVIDTKGFFDESGFQADELHGSISDMRFMFISNAVAALLEIGKGSTKKIRKYIIGQIKNKISEDYDIKICLKDNPYISYNMADIISRQIQLYINMEDV